MIANGTPAGCTRMNGHVNKIARGSENDVEAWVTIDDSTLTDDPLTMTGALRQTVADVRATTGVRCWTMMDVYLTMKINTRLVSLTDPRLIVPREFSQKMRGVWVPISLWRLVCLHSLPLLPLAVLLSLWPLILSILLMMGLWLVTIDLLVVLLCQRSSITKSFQLHILRLLWGNVQLRRLPYTNASPIHMTS
jgi:hypothetical protein